MADNYWTDEDGLPAYNIVSSELERQKLLRTGAYQEVGIFCSRMDWVDNLLPGQDWKREADNVAPNVNKVTERLMMMANVPDDGYTMIKKKHDEMGWHALMISCGPAGAVEGDSVAVDTEDWDSVPDYDPQPDVVKAPQVVPPPAEDESLSRYYARIALRSGETVAKSLLENREVEINRRLPIWKQRVQTADPVESDYIEQASGEVMQYVRSNITTPAIKARVIPPPPCEISLLGEVRALPEAYEPLNILRVAQKKGPAHLIFHRPEDVNAALDSIYRPYVAVRFGELSMPRATLAYWWRGTVRSVVAVYWSDTKSPSQAILSCLEFIDFSPLASVRQFSVFFLEKLHPRTVVRLIRRAYFRGTLFSIDTEGDPMQPSDISILRATPGQRPLPITIDRVGDKVLFVAKGAYAEYRYLVTQKREALLDADGNGLLDIGPYVRWFREQRKHHRAIDGASQALSKALELAMDIPSVYQGFSKEKTSFFLSTTFPPAPSRGVRAEASHHCMRGETPMVTRQIRTEGMRLLDNMFKGYTNDDQCNSIHANINVSDRELNCIGDVMSSFDLKTQTELDVLEQYPLKVKKGS